MLTLIGFSQMRLVYLLVASIRAWFPRLPTVAGPNPSSILAGWAGHKFMHTKHTSIVAKIADETDRASIISSLNFISARSFSSVVINSVSFGNFKPAFFTEIASNYRANCFLFRVWKCSHYFGFSDNLFRFFATAIATAVIPEMRHKFLFIIQPCSYDHAGLLWMQLWCIRHTGNQVISSRRYFPRPFLWWTSVALILQIAQNGFQKRKALARWLYSRISFTILAERRRIGLRDFIIGIHFPA